MHSLVKVNLINLTEVGALCYSVLPEVATLVYSLANSLNFKGFIDFKHQLVYGEREETRTPGVGIPD